MNDWVSFWLLTVLVTFSTFAAAYGVYLLIDICCGKPTQVVGTVITKTNAPTDSIQSWIKSTPFSHNSYLTDKRKRTLYLTIKVQGVQKKIIVSKNIFDTYSFGDKIDVDMRIGRFSKNIIIVDITAHQALDTTYV